MSLALIKEDKDYFKENDLLKEIFLSNLDSQSVHLTSIIPLKYLKLFRKSKMKSWFWRKALKS